MSFTSKFDDCLMCVWWSETRNLLQVSFREIHPVERWNKMRGYRNGYNSEGCESRFLRCFLFTVSSWKKQKNIRPTFGSMLLIYALPKESWWCMGSTAIIQGKSAGKRQGKRWGWSLATIRRYSLLISANPRESLLSFFPNLFFFLRVLSA